MNTILKTGLLTLSIAILFSIPSGNANAGTGTCLQEYRACVAAGYPEMDCENGYWYCKYGYIPAKSITLPLTGNRRN